ncbi:MAG: glucose 1-dehydrogenase [Acidimicrobiales bacterium]
MGTLDDKVALITGGARGQGAAEGRLFAAEGATVHLTDVLDDEGKTVADEIGGTFHHHDVTSPSEWADVVATVMAADGRIDVLINNAGIFRIEPMSTTSDELWDRIIAINQTGVFLGMRAVAPIMTEQRSGSMINISSIAGLRGSAAAFAYGASKWAVRGMTKNAALELAPHGVRVNSIHPGIIDTPMAEEFDRVGVRDQVKANIPIGYLADAEDVAKLALYLASDASSYSTGSEFVVDGGFTA